MKELAYIIGGLITVIVIMLSLAIFMDFVVEFTRTSMQESLDVSRIIAGTSVKP